MGFHKVQQLRGKERAIVEEEGTEAVRKGLHMDLTGGLRSKVSETVSGVSIRNVMDGGECWRGLVKQSNIDVSMQSRHTPLSRHCYLFD